MSVCLSVFLSHKSFDIHNSFLALLAGTSQLYVHVGFLSKYPE